MTPEEQHDELDVPLPEAPQITSRRQAVFGAALLGALAVLFVLGLLPKLRQRSVARADAAERAGPVRVQIQKPVRAPGSHALTLPASVQPLQETDVHPRASGYVRRWLVDIGDRVKAGQLLVEIDTPEVDQQLAQSQATLGQREAAVIQANANSQLARSMLARSRSLLPGGFASKQELDQREAEAAVGAANVQAAQAAVAAQRADLRRLQQLKSFARVTAPFAGLVTARWVELGSLVTGTSRLFSVAATDPVRVFVKIPQSLSPGVRAGLAAHVSVHEFPGRAFEGRVTRTAGALDMASRTLNTEVQVPNAQGLLLAGMYAQVTLELPQGRSVLLVPAGAILARASGPQVAVVDAASKIHLLPVSISRDDGAQIEIDAGLTGDEELVVNPGARVEEGLQVAVSPG